MKVVCQNLILHHRKLVPNKRGMSNYDILTLQSETANDTLNLQLKIAFLRLFYPWSW
jgi:hypothetical protein